MPRPNKVAWHETGRWFFTKVIGGKRRFFYASPEIPNTKEGERRAKAWMEQEVAKNEERLIDGEAWMLGDLRLTYLTWCKQRVAEKVAKQHTFDGHRKHLNLICAMKRGSKTYGQMFVRDLTTKVVGELVGRWKAPTKDADGRDKPGLGATTIRNRIGSLQAMLNWAAQPRHDRTRERLIAENPIRGYELPSIEYQGDRYAPATEVASFLEWVDVRASEATGASARFERLTAKLIRLVAETGARPGEICAFEWRHYDAESWLIQFPPEEHKTGGKTKKPRLILLTAELAAMMEEIRADPSKHPTHVFTHAVRRLGSTEQERKHGDPWNSNALSRRVKELRRAARAAGIPLEDQGVKRMHLYRLRHSHITNDMQSPNRPSIVDVATLHGTSVKMIEGVYLHPQIEHLRGVMNRLRDASKPKEPEGESK